VTPPALADRIAALAKGGGRTLVALAGPPGSGKSTLAETLAADVSARGIAAEVVPMDGFHLDNAILTARGLLPRKGAPETFDAAGFLSLIERLKRGGEVAIPVFDRARDLAIAGARIIGADCRVLIVEGNYLLFDEPDWRALAALWDLSVFLDVAEPVLAERLTRRWLDHGLPPDAARARAETNDLANARRILARRLPADLVLDTANAT
jgi:pantothenate kinase